MEGAENEKSQFRKSDDEVVSSQRKRKKSLLGEHKQTVMHY